MVSHRTGQPGRPKGSRNKPKEEAAPEKPAAGGAQASKKRSAAAMQQPAGPSPQAQQQGGAAAAAAAAAEPAHAPVSELEKQRAKLAGELSAVEARVSGAWGGAASVSRLRGVGGA